ncbi:conserved hypothetical protein [Culex quinquefasciatus]|uniref:Uncharacterized protein n=1 Tax=Culex quinquefasciatus TaxID=7176 RepID=B0X2I3_CULQU|nr:conserved hypothetical protein [Culex quinquefasciatus]|eukprot:XP_001863855.1 conserved hypothetical protein [Culex quinquefasciatus]
MAGRSAVSPKCHRPFGRRTNPGVSVLECHDDLRKDIAQTGQETILSFKFTVLSLVPESVSSVPCRIWCGVFENLLAADGPPGDPGRRLNAASGCCTGGRRSGHPPPWNFVVSIGCVAGGSLHQWSSGMTYRAAVADWLRCSLCKRMVLGSMPICSQRESIRIINLETLNMNENSKSLGVGVRSPVLWIESISPQRMVQLVQISESIINYLEPLLPSPFECWFYYEQSNLPKNESVIRHILTSNESILTPRVVLSSPFDPFKLPTSRARLVFFEFSAENSTFAESDLLVIAAPETKYIVIVRGRSCSEIPPSIWVAFNERVRVVYLLVDGDLICLNSPLAKKLMEFRRPFLVDVLFDDSTRDLNGYPIKFVTLGFGNYLYAKINGKLQGPNIIPDIQDPVVQYAVDLQNSKMFFLKLFVIAFAGQVLPSYSISPERMIQLVNISTDIIQYRKSILTNSFECWFIYEQSCLPRNESVIQHVLTSTELIFTPRVVLSSPFNLDDTLITRTRLIFFEFRTDVYTFAAEDALLMGVHPKTKFVIIVRGRSCAEIPPSIHEAFKLRLNAVYLLVDADVICRYVSLVRELLEIRRPFAVDELFDDGTRDLNGYPIKFVTLGFGNYLYATNNDKLFGSSIVCAYETKLISLITSRPRHATFKSIQDLNRAGIKVLLPPYKLSKYQEDFMDIQFEPMLDVSTFTALDMVHSYLFDEASLKYSSKETVRQGSSYTALAEKSQKVGADVEVRAGVRPRRLHRIQQIFSNFYLESESVKSGIFGELKSSFTSYPASRVGVVFKVWIQSRLEVPDSAALTKLKRLQLTTPRRHNSVGLRFYFGETQFNYSTIVKTAHSVVTGVMMAVVEGSKEMRIPFVETGKMPKLWSIFHGVLL